MSDTPIDVETPVGISLTQRQVERLVQTCMPLGPDRRHPDSEPWSSARWENMTADMTGGNLHDPIREDWTWAYLLGGEMLTMIVVSAWFTARGIPHQVAWDSYLGDEGLGYCLLTDHALTHWTSFYEGKS